VTRKGDAVVVPIGTSRIQGTVSRCVGIGGVEPQLGGSKVGEKTSTVAEADLRKCSRTIKPTLQGLP